MVTNSMLNTTSSVMERTIPEDPFRAYLDSLDLAGQMVERQMSNDSNFPSLIQMMRLSPDSGATLSGQNDSDYPSLTNLSAGLANLKLLKTGNKTPLPREVMEHFGHMQFHCTMGLFTEIHRAFLTIDSDIFVWTYEHGSDVAYFDGLGETILCVGLVKPKPGVFNSFVRYLLVLVTTIEIVIVGVTFTCSADGPLGPLEEMNVIPEPVFVLPTEGVTYTTVTSSDNGRIFLGGKDGNLYEVVYQAEGGWFSKRCRKVNHSQGTLSYLLPSFLNVAFAEEDPISQIVIDNGRFILYSLSHSGSITVFDMGSDGLSMSRTTMMQQATIVQHAIKIVDKTLDSSNFRPLVSICPIESRESPHLNLVGVTQTGTRLYFTCGSVNRKVRPYSLNLLHVRLPPGYAANPPSYRPANVHTAHYRKGNTVLISSPGGDHDMLQCLSSDMYPFHPYLVEVQTALPVDGVVWAFAEVKNEGVGCKFIASSNNLGSSEGDGAPSNQTDLALDAADPPLIVTQHMEPPKKYVVLTPQGAEVLIKLRPVDLLRQILIDCRGPENEAVKTYFEVQQEDQACATCLILACSESSRNAQVSEWATRAFFFYGGEPKIPKRYPMLPKQRRDINQMMSPLPYAAPEGFNPTMVSTPIMNHPAMSPNTTLPTMPTMPTMGMNTPSSGANVAMTFSAKHNGLYLYVSRILRPIWLQRVTQRVTMDNSKQFLVSSVSGDDCVWILGHLHALVAFLNKNSQLSLLNCSSSQVHSVDDRPLDIPLSLRIQQDAQLKEKRSLDSLKTFLSHTCEVLGLWKVLSDHQFHCLADGLNQEDQSQLAVMTFRDLILVGHVLCSALINSLIKSYLNDNASVDSVSAKLREVCPKLYRNEDAACNKANEMLLKAKTKQNVDEKEGLLRGALKLCKEVAPNLNLSAACAKFIGVQWYEGVLELCLAYAAKIDPKDVALHYYNNGEPSEDTQGCTLYMQRMDAYKELISLLDQLYVQGPCLMEQDKPSTSVRNSTLDSSIQTATDLALLPVPAKRLISRALRSEDTLCHVAIYEWMLRRRLEGELLSGGAPYPGLEAFLARASRLQPDSLQIADLLWKFYERNQNHAAAAQILHQLATKNRNDVSLKERVSYLARAVMCMRSDKVGAAPHLGVFLRELEDLMEVVRVQQQILNAIANFQRSYPVIEAAQAIQRLNSCLFDMTQLYQEFAEPFDLWECKLAIIHVSGHMDPTLIENIWLNIIDQEMKKPSASTEEKLSALMGKVKALGREYALASRSFPIPLLVKALEVEVCRARGDPAVVHSTMLATGVSLNTLLDVYEKMIATNDRCWLAEGNEFHLVQAVAEMVDTFTNNPNLVNNANRRSAVAKADDVVSKCLNDVYSKPGNATNNELIERLRAIQAKLNRMAVR